MRDTDMSSIMENSTSISHFVSLDEILKIWLRRPRNDKNELDETYLK